ncbi:MAG: type II toxin-antitoxin system RelE/ParE family toxin [Candidatus Magasanikbacteria bacterium]
MSENWQIFIAPEANQDLESLDAEVESRIRDKIQWLCDNFGNITPSSLGGKWRGFFKLRVGDWRVIYKINWKESALLVVTVGKRDEIYD